MPSYKILISCFESVLKVSEPTHIDIAKALERFKVDKYGIIDNRDKETFKEFKKKLPIATFGGTFSSRSKNGLMKHSGLLTLDFDDITAPIELKADLVSRPYVYSCFISPSGKGVKALVKIPICESDKEYKEYYSALQKEFKNLDESGKDISRCCFFSYDPDIYINTECETYDQKIIEDSIPKMSNAQVKNDYSIANRVLNIIRGAVIGERHDKILKASRLMGGYVAAGRISISEAMRLLENECYAIAPQTPRENLQTIQDGLENGMLAPLEGDHELETEELEMKLGKIYYTQTDLDEEIDELYKDGLQKGYELSFESMYDKISIKLGCTTFIYGAPYCGKSQIWFEMLVDLSVRYGIKHAVYSPETGSASEIFIELMTIYGRKDFYKHPSAERMTPDELQKAKNFVDRHFVVIDPDDGVFTIEDFWTYLDIIERVFEVKISTSTADPFNEFRHDFSKDNGRQDMYIERILGENRRNARANKRHNCIITHVQDQPLQRQGEISYYEPATFRQIAGGQAWSRKGEQMISVWRPREGLLNDDGMPYEHNQTVLIVQKSKPKGIGRTGMIDLYYSAREHSYYEMKWGQPYFPSRVRDGIGITSEDKKQTPITQSKEFDDAPF